MSSREISTLTPSQTSKEQQASNKNSAHRVIDSRTNSPFSINYLHSYSLRRTSYTRGSRQHSSAHETTLERPATGIARVRKHDERSVHAEGNDSSEGFEASRSRVYLWQRVLRTKQLGSSSQGRVANQEINFRYTSTHTHTHARPHTHMDERLRASRRIFFSTWSVDSRGQLLSKDGSIDLSLRRGFSMDEEFFRKQIETGNEKSEMVGYFRSYSPPLLVFYFQSFKSDAERLWSSSSFKFYLHFSFGKCIPERRL